MGALGQCSEFTTAVDLEDCRTPDRVRLDAANAEAWEKAKALGHGMFTPTGEMDPVGWRLATKAHQEAAEAIRRDADEELLDAEAARIRMLLARPQRKKARK